MTPHGKLTKTQENFTYRRTKRSALSQQVTRGLQRTDTKACLTRNINNKYDQQKKHRLRTVSKNSFTGGLKLVSQKTL